MSFAVSNLMKVGNSFGRVKKGCVKTFGRNESKPISLNSVCNFKQSNFGTRTFFSKTSYDLKCYQSKLYNHNNFGIKREYCTEKEDQKLQYVNENVMTDKESEKTKPKSQKDMIAIFTCNVCETRKDYHFSKHSYQKGIVIVRCPGCQKLHLVADNLGWFRDEKTNIEDLSREAGKTPLVVSGESAHNLLNALGISNPLDPTAEDSEKLVKNIVVHDRTSENKKEEEIETK